MIQQILTAVENQYTTEMKKFNTGHFTRDIHQILMYFHNTYGGILQGQQRASKKEVNKFHYGLINTIDNVFIKVKDLIKYTELDKNTYIQTQAIAKAYNIINTTGMEISVQEV